MRGIRDEILVPLYPCFEQVKFRPLGKKFPTCAQGKKRGVLQHCLPSPLHRTASLWPVELPLSRQGENHLPPPSTSCPSLSLSNFSHAHLYYSGGHPLVCRFRIMAISAKESGGLDLSFVTVPPDDLVCSICLSVHLEPVLTSCCGNHFCFSCVEQVRVEQRPCPLCGASHFTTMLDKYFVRKVNELEVRCKHAENGCLWLGCVSELQRHLDSSTGDCMSFHVECPYVCGTLLVSAELEKHQKVCSKRPYVCKFCEYKGVYEDMSSKHWKMCEKYPLPCPNHCTW